MDNVRLKTVEKIIYLDQNISFKDRMSEELDKKIALIWNKYWTLNYIFEGPFKNRHKYQIFNS